MEARFTEMDWDTRDHEADLVKSAQAGHLVPIVDDRVGGIIAYVIGPEYASLITTALNRA